MESKSWDIKVNKFWREESFQTRKTQDIPDLGLSSLFMGSNYKRNAVHTLSQILKQYCIFETTQNEFIIPKDQKI